MPSITYRTNSLSNADLNMFSLRPVCHISPLPGTRGGYILASSSYRDLCLSSSLIISQLICLSVIQSVSQSICLPVSQAISLGPTRPYRSASVCQSASKYRVDTTGATLHNESRWNTLPVATDSSSQHIIIIYHTNVSISLVAIGRAGKFYFTFLIKTFLQVAKPRP